ncbi:hypothetical protein [Yoonia maritima]|uniref:hypothetical protein n=1 Tax=Yoonia maritima TaxID=1435347 RepID=UPI0013A62BA5|nr:hypothetical protein [Yoonia maritima]
MSTNPPVELPFKVFSDTPARNIENPMDGIGVLHNIVMDMALKSLADIRYAGRETTPQQTHKQVLSIFDRIGDWSLRCVCVTGENCPCKDLLDWLRDTIPGDGFPGDPFPANLVPTSRPDPDVVIQQLEQSFDTTQREAVIGYFKRIRVGTAEAERSHEKLVSLERRISADSALNETARTLLLVNASVARHSRFMTLSLGRSEQQAGSAGQADVDGAALGGTVGAAGGPEAIIPGALIGGGVFSLCTALDNWL